MDTMRLVGQTRDTGFQVGARRTFPVSLEVAWRWLISREGLELWLGSGPELELAEGVTYRLADGTSGEVRVLKPGSHLRLTWQPPGWPRASTIQVRVIQSGEKTVVAFHQEHLPGSKAREDRRVFFRGVLDLLTDQFGGR